jgi:hypothetical protein
VEKLGICPSGRSPARRTPADEERGQTLIEYGLMAALLAIVAVSALALVGQHP